ncbi:hypothetical protein OCS_06820 [Ophiocordyceps sinensis CO18]|uniref:Glycoside hydrolase family 5 C-terminal domain-containing protein n=1 Tax=Ophiocordyceps sinensis (strain Co18 / CGMCC 3.14243) TaxID=911162 RepID=T5A4E2_OPHSC|nr:hypothetical protein OCS_06820 [Ophiocordyceps sinensis CO18]
MNREAGDDETVTPGNLQRTLTNPSISSSLSVKDPGLTNAPGYRAADAFIRPTPTVLKAPRAAADEVPTIVFLPDFHFPKDQCEVTVSSGKWEISSDEDEGPWLQRLRWWHAAGQQSLSVRGTVRQNNALQGSAEEAGYLEQCQQGYGFNFGSCVVL